MTNKELISSFWTTLFDPEDRTCFALNKFGTSLSNVSSARIDVPRYRDLQYFSINAMEGDSRADLNVTKHRNILVEFDKIPLDEQLKVVQRMGLPYSTRVFSGSKSFHFIISLEEPLRDRDIYDFSVEWIYNILEPHGVDTQTSNPSRFSRVPGGTNQKEHKVLDDEGNVVLEDGKPKLKIMYSEQKLISVGPRVPNETLEAWLLSHPEHQPIPMIYERIIILSDHAAPHLLTPWTKHLLANGINNGKRNAEVFKMGFDFVKCGFTCEEAVSYFAQNAKQLGDFTLAEAEAAIKSAYKTFHRRQGHDRY